MLDEIQLGGDALIRAIKSETDGSEERGQFLLNGSANFLTVPHITARPSSMVPQRDRPVWRD